VNQPNKALEVVQWLRTAPTVPHEGAFWIVVRSEEAPASHRTLRKHLKKLTQAGLIRMAKIQVDGVPRVCIQWIAALPMIEAHLIPQVGGVSNLPYDIGVSMSTVRHDPSVYGASKTKSHVTKGTDLRRSGAGLQTFGEDSEESSEGEKTLKVKDVVQEGSAKDPTPYLNASTCYELTLLWKRSWAAAGIGGICHVDTKNAKLIEHMHQLWHEEDFDASFGEFVVLLMAKWSSAQKYIAKKAGWGKGAPESPEIPWIHYNFGHAANWFMQKKATSAPKGKSLDSL
jgi:hypothetical protein